MSNKIRDLVSMIAGYDDSIPRLGALALLLEQNSEAVEKEINLRMEFISLWNAPGKKACKHCHGYGKGLDGRGDPWTCYDCKPQLKNFWNGK